MKNCISCGANIEDIALYCALCGFKQEAELVVPPGYHDQPLTNFVPTSSPFKLTNGRDILLKHGSSRMYLAFIILFSITTILSIASQFVSIFSADMENTLRQMYGNSEVMGLELKTILLYSTYAEIAIAIVFMAMLVLLVCASVLIYLACKNKTYSIVGFTIIKIVTITSLVFASLLLALYILYVLISFGNDIGPLILLVPFVFALLLCSYLIFKTLSNLVKSFCTGALLCVPQIVPILLCIAAGIFILNVLFTFNFNLTTISLLFECAQIILFALCLFGYNRSVRSALVTLNLDDLFSRMSNNGL